MTGPLHSGGGAYVPKEIAVCPECGSQLTARSHSWDAETGVPCAVDIEIECTADELDDPSTWHKFHQCDWQPVRDAVAQWAGAIQ